MRIAALLLLLVGCHAAPVSVSDAGPDARATPAPALPATDGGHRFGSGGGSGFTRGFNIIDGTGISTTYANNATTGQADITITSTVVGGVSNVTGGGSTSCSPTTGAVVCTTANSVSNGLTGASTFTAHGPLVGAGTGAIVAVTCPNNLPLTGNTGADPSCRILPIAGGGFGSDLTTCSNNQGAILESPGFGAFGCIGPGTTGQVLTMIGPTAPGWVTPPAFANKAFGTGALTLTTSVQNIVGVTATTGTEVLIEARFQFASGDIQNNGINYGESTNSTVSIVNTNNANVLAGTTFGAGGTYTCNYMRILHLSSLTAGSNTFNFLAQLQAAFNTSAPLAEAEVIVNY